MPSHLPTMWNGPCKKSGVVYEPDSPRAKMEFPCSAVAPRSNRKANPGPPHRHLGDICGGQLPVSLVPGYRNDPSQTLCGGYVCGPSTTVSLGLWMASGKPRKLEGSNLDRLSPK